MVGCIMPSDYRIFEITDGTDTVDLTFTAPNSATTFVPGGGSQIQLTPHAWDESINNLEATTFSERWQLVYKGGDTDELARKVDKLLKLLRKAWLNTNSRKRQWTPVYIKQRAVGETETRWAIVYGSPDVMLQPYMFSQSFEVMQIIKEFGVGITRGLWQSGVPGVLPDAITLDATDGPSGRSLIHVPNERSDLNVASIFNFDSSLAAWSANLSAIPNHDIWSVGGAVPAAGDIYYIGGFRAFHNTIWNIVTAGVYDADVAIEYSDGGGGWPTLDYGDECTIYPNGDENEIFKSVGDWGLNNIGPSNWASETVNGADRYWIRLRLNAVTAWTTTPQNGTANVYFPRKPCIDIPSDAFSGSISPLLHMRYKTPDGGDDDPGFSSMSRLVCGVRTNPRTFVSRLHAYRADIVPGWARVAGIDAGGAQDPAGPRGETLEVDFSTTDPLTVRTTITGTDKLDDWRGLYRVFVRAQQAGGAAGDVSLMVRTLINSAAATSTKMDSQIVAMKGVDEGIEVVDMFDGGVLQIPFTENVSDDDFTGCDLIFEIHASRDTGSAATLKIYDLILIPVDEWSVELNDPISDSDDGTSALRGLNMLDDDAGVVLNRTVKRIIDGSHIYSGEEWTRKGKAPEIEPGVDAKIFFLMMHYKSGGDWGDAPMMASCGMHFAFELRKRDRYFYLRGAD